MLLLKWDTGKVRDRFCVRCKGWVKSRIKQVADIDRILEKTIRPKKVYQKYPLFCICNGENLTRVQNVLKTDQGADVSAHDFFSAPVLNSVITHLIT